MPRVCVQFPRQLSNFGTFCEETVYLACPEAASLFIEQARAKISFDFEEATGEPSYEGNTTNALNTALSTDELSLIMAVHERRAPQIEDALSELISKQLFPLL